MRVDSQRHQNGNRPSMIGSALPAIGRDGLHGWRLYEPSRSHDSDERTRPGNFACVCAVTSPATIRAAARPRGWHWRLCWSYAELRIDCFLSNSYESAPRFGTEGSEVRILSPRPMSLRKARRNAGFFLVRYRPDFFFGFFWRAVHSAFSSSRIASNSVRVRPCRRSANSPAQIAFARAS